MEEDNTADEWGNIPTSEFVTEDSFSYFYKK